MENQLTLEQSLQNITIVLEQFKGNKQEHVVLEASLNKIKENLIKSEIKSTKKD